MFYVRYERTIAPDGREIGDGRIVSAEFMTEARGRIAFYRFRPARGAEQLWLASGESFMPPAMRLPLDTVSISSAFGVRADPFEQPRHGLGAPSRVGAVGAKLLFGDGSLQHAGVIFDDEGPGHVYRTYPGDHGGYFNMLKAANNFQAVTGACLMTPRAVFDEVGGLSTLLPLNFNDIDYCLKVGRLGLRAVVDPDTTLYHFESSSRSAVVTEAEVGILQQRHGYAAPDPYYNPSFLQSSRDYVAPVMLADGTLL